MGGGGELSEKFPRFFNITLENKAMIGALREWFKGRWHWNWGEFCKLIFWKTPSLVGVLICVKGGVWYRMCGRQTLWLI